MLIHNLVATGSLSYNGVNISYVTGSQTSLDGLNQFSASVNTTTGSLSSSIAILSGSYLTMSGSYSSASGSLSTRVTTIESKYATTGSNIFTGAQTVCANITSTGTIVAQTLNVQQVTSSIVYSSGSNIFGCSTSDVQQITGSLRMTGSIATFSTNCFGIGTSTPLAYNNYVALTVGDNSTTKTGLIKIRSCYNAGDGAEVYQTTAGTFTIATNGSDSAFRIFSNNIASFTCQTCAPGMDIMPSGIGVSTLGGIMRVVTTGTSTGIAVGQSNSNRYTHIAANDIQVFNDDFFLTTRCAFPLSIGTCYTARLTFAATGVACFSCQVCTPSLIATGADTTGTNVAIVNTSTGGTYWNIFSGGSAASLGPAGSLIIRDSTNGATRVTLSQSGNLNVGNGTAATYGLVCSSNLASSMGITFHNGSTYSKVGAVVSIQESGGSHALSLWTRSGGNEQESMRITSAGNVGIGTASPKVLLDVVGGTNTTLSSAADVIAKFKGSLEINSLSTASSGCIDRIYFNKSHTAGINVATYTLGEIRSFTSNGYAGGLDFYTGRSLGAGAYGTCLTMRLDESGNVGIGTTSPNTTLEVRGSGNTAINTTGNLFVASGGTATQGAGQGGQISFGAWLNGDLGRPYPVAMIKGVSECSTTNYNYGALLFGTMDSNTTVQERMRINSSGLLKVQNIGVTYESSTAGVNEIGTCANDTNLVFRNVRGSLTGARAGVDVFYAYAQPNSADASFYEAADSTDGSTRTLRFKVASNGTVYARSTSITLISSDCKLKTDIVDYDKGLCEVISMKPRYYKYKDNLSQIHSGFIAQEMNEALPGSMIQSYIDQDCNPVMTYQVDWYPLLVNAIKQQQCKINILESCLGIN